MRAPAGRRRVGARAARAAPPGVQACDGGEDAGPEPRVAPGGRPGVCLRTPTGREGRAEWRQKHPWRARRTRGGSGRWPRVQAGSSKCTQLNKLYLIRHYIPPSWYNILKIHSHTNAPRSLSVITSKNLTILLGLKMFPLGSSLCPHPQRMLRLGPPRRSNGQRVSWEWVSPCKALEGFHNSPKSSLK